MPRALKRPGPLSLRLSDAEREFLVARAGGAPLSAYIKQQLFADGDISRPRLRRVTPDRRLLGQVLAYLGSSQLSQSLARLSHAARDGTLLLDDATARRLDNACDDARAMHLLLLQALGKKPPLAPARSERLTVQFQRASFDGEDGA